MKVIRMFWAALARFFLSFVFLAGAVHKILHWHDSEKSFHAILCEWQFHLGFSQGAHDCFQILIPLSPIILLAGTFIELIASVMLLLGIKEKLSAYLLIIFLVPVTVIMHQFWFVEGVMKEQQLFHFLKNFAIIGGLMIITLQNKEKPFAKGPFTKF